jgi:FkbM family methyltransferase
MFAKFATLVYFGHWGVRPITQRRFTSMLAEAAEMRGEIARMLVERDQMLAERDQMLAERDQMLAERDQMLAERDQMLVERDRMLAERDRMLAERDSKLGEIRDEIEANRRALLVAAETRRRLDVSMAENAHLKRENEHYMAAVAANEEAGLGVQTFVDEFQRILFDRRETTEQSRSASTLVLRNRPADDAISTLVNFSEPDHGARPFQYMVPFWASRVPFPLPWPREMVSLRIVDVGAQELDYESDVYASLGDVAPIDTVGFDPFVPPSDLPDRKKVIRRPDGRVIHVYPYLIADGKEVTFHINRLDATSSILSSNHTLTQPFGQLDKAVETVSTQRFPSRRLDDVLADETAVDLLKIDMHGAAHAVLDGARALLRRTLVCHVEAEFAPVYVGERLFADIDALLRDAGFAFVDFFNLGRQRYASFEASRSRAFHRGRTLWADCVYVRALDSSGALTADELFRAAVIVHTCYNKQDLAAELLGRCDAITGGSLREAYIVRVTTEAGR